MMAAATKRLADLGERRIIDEVLRPRYGMTGLFGDDCAVLAPEGVGDAAIVATTDPCPHPVAALVGWDDLYYWGWLGATINLSDLAASGARPLGLLASYDLPTTTLVGEFERLLDGVDDACVAAGTAVAGGNIRDAAVLGMCATAIGACPSGRRLRRTGAEPGDEIVVIGPLGAFLAGAVAEFLDLDLPDGDRDWLLPRLLTPRAQVASGMALATRGLVKAAIDNSDGLLGACRELARSNGCGVDVDSSSLTLHGPARRVAEAAALDPIKLALGFGDWQLVVVIEEGRSAAVVEVVRGLGQEATLVGRMTDGLPIVTLDGTDGAVVTGTDHQRFSSESWSAASFEGVVSDLRSLEPS